MDDHELHNQLHQQHMQEQFLHQQLQQEQRNATELGEIGGTSGRKRKITYRPSKAQGVLSLVVGIGMGLFGLFFFAATEGSAKLFALVWLIWVIGIVGVNVGRAFGKHVMGPEIHIEEENHGASPSGSEMRLEQLRSLYEKRLITTEEYEQKRAEILKEL